MVTYKTKSIWKCPYCEKDYDNENDAYECARECADIDSPEEDEKSIYGCEYCGKKFNDEDDAESHEKLHKENKDDAYTKVKLKEAGEHPNQSKIKDAKGDKSE